MKINFTKMSTPPNVTIIYSRVGVYHSIFVNDAVKRNIMFPMTARDTSGMLLPDRYFRNG